MLVYIIISILLPIAWSLVFLPLKIFGINIYKSPNIENVKQNYCFSTIISNGNPDGFIFGKDFIVFQGYILCRQSTFESIQKVNSGIISLNFDIRTVQDVRLYETRIQKTFKPKRWQRKAAKGIEKVFRKQGYCTVYNVGEPGSGKSTLANILAQRLSDKDVYICNNFNPSLSCHSLNVLLSYGIGSDYLIVVIEEVDTILNRLEVGITGQNKDVPATVRDKPSWNLFLDSISNHQNLILILNSNTEFTGDKSFLRDGRVDYRTQ